MHDDPETMAKLMRPVGKKVTFLYPPDEGHKHGTLKDRAIVASNPGTTGVPYWDVVDLITFPDEPEPEWVRIGYYRMPKGRLVWGSQTTITEPVAVWKRILVGAARQKAWFRTLLEEAVDELRKTDAQPPPAT